MTGVRRPTVSAPPGAAWDHVPRPLSRWVDRPSLDRRLDGALTHALTLVVAPAGAGKTSSSAAWCRARCPVPVTWLSGESRPPDATPLAELAAAILDAAGVERALELAELRPAALRRTTTAALAGRTADGLVLVDDAHLLHPLALRLVATLLDSCPRALRLVLLCRWDPGLPRLPAAMRGDVQEIRGEALRMSDDEARTLVRAHGPGLPEAPVRAILEVAQGWPALLALAAHSVASAPDPVLEAAHLGEPGPAIADLLANEVFATLPERTRRTLLCVAGEDTVDAATAARLSGDPLGGDSLTALASTGLLVSQVGGAPSPSYRLHPLLREVVRRRAAAGGVVVAEARALVRHAALDDLAAGRVPEGLRRLVQAHAWPDAVEALSRHGEHALLKTPAPVLAALADAAPVLVQRSPRATLMTALDRWARDDVEGALPLLQRARDDCPTLPFAERSLARLLLARVGAEPWEEAAAAVRRRLEAAGGTATGAPLLLGWLLTELGRAESWAGRLDAAEAHLRRGVMLAEPSSDDLRLDALSQLAQVEYLRGNVRTATAMAAQVHSQLPRAGVLRESVADRAQVIALLGDPSAEVPSDCDLDAPGSSAGDPVSRVLRHLVGARRRAATAGFEAAAAWLDLPALPRPLSPHLTARWTLERAFVALRLGDAALLRALASGLDGVEAHGERQLVLAFLADLEGRVPVSILHLRRVGPAGRGSMLAVTPSIAAVAEAQLLAALGERGEGIRTLEEAVRETAGQRRLAPFLLRTVHGVPTHELIGEVVDVPPDWAAELSGVTHRLAGYAFPPLASRREPLAPAPGPGPIRVALTDRETDVLAELARGSTYADIARTLYVTENTVKTHVSSLYAKLGAARRSEALGTARQQGLL